MILYLKDWKDYPNATLQLNTSNESFLRVAKLLKYMGVKNHGFMLSLLNPALLNVDPWSPNLTEAEILMITEEVQNNFWYFLREVYRVPPPAGNTPIKFKANRANISYFWLFFNHITTLLIQPRQTGKSLSYETKDMYLSGIQTNNYDISILVKDDKLRNSVSRKIINKFEYLPWYLNLMSNKDVKNSEKITVKALNNVINIYVGQRDPKLADNVGRGMTTPVDDIDEFAYVPNIAVTLPAMLASTTAAREIAESQGLPYGNTLLTTPGKLGTKEGRFAYSIYKQSFRWTEKLFDSDNRKDLLDVIIKNSSFKMQPIVLLEYNHRQLGYTDNWLVNRIETAMADGEEAEADFLNRWTSGSMKHPLTKKQLEILTKSKQKPLYSEITNQGYVIRWYITEEELKTHNRYTYYIISLDPSDAVGSDDIGFHIRDAYSGETLAAGNYNETSTTTFSIFLKDLLVRFPNSLLLVERRSTGSTIIDNVLAMLSELGINGFRRIFNWTVNDLNSTSNEHDLVFAKNIYDDGLYAKYRKKFGFATSGGGETSRSNLYSVVLKAATKYTGDVAKDELLVDQITSLTIRNNRVDHEEGGHDDLVIAWLLSYWFLTSAKNKQIYGLDVDRILSNVIDAELVNEATDEEREYILFQEQLKAKIEEYIDELKNTKDTITAARILGRINVLKKNLDPRYVKTFNVDTVIRDLKFYKKLKKMGYVR